MEFNLWTGKNNNVFWELQFVSIHRHLIFKYSCFFCVDGDVLLHRYKHQVTATCIIILCVLPDDCIVNEKSLLSLLPLWIIVVPLLAYLHVWFKIIYGKPTGPSLLKTTWKNKNTSKNWWEKEKSQIFLPKKLGQPMWTVGLDTSW